MKCSHTLKAHFYQSNEPYNYPHVILKIQIFIYDERAGGNEQLVQKIDEEMKRQELKGDAHLCQLNF